MSRVVLDSIETLEGDRCVDLFRRSNGRFGFETFRRDPEGGGQWYVAAGFADQVHSSRDDAVAAARRRIAWLDTETK